MKKFLVLSALIIIFPLIASAASPSLTTNACSGVGDASSIPKCVNQVYIWSMAVGALLALLMIVVGGIMTLTSAGNAARASRGREYITSSVVGLALLFGAYLLLRTINPDLVNFNINSVNNTQTQTTPLPQQ